MQKFKVPAIVIAVLLLVVAVYFLFFSSSVYDGVPKSAIAVIEVNNWNQFADKLNTTSTGSELKKTDAAQKLLSEVALIQELLSSDKGLKEEIATGKTLASVHLTSATDYDFLFTTTLSGVNDNTILNHVQLSAKTRSVKVRIFKNNKVVDVILKDGRQLSFAKLKDILVFSFTPFLTENGMTAIQSGDNLNSDKDFKSVRVNLSSTADVNLYFNFQKAEVLFPVAFKAERISLLNDVSNCGTWGHYEVSLSNDKMELDGSIATNSEALQPTENIFSKSLQTLIPAHAAYVHFSKIDTTYADVTLSNYFKNWMGDTKAFAILEPFKEDFTEQNVFIISCRDKRKATEDLKQLMATAGTTAAPVDTFLNSEIYHLQDGSVINQLFGNSLIGFKNCFFCIQNDAVIFCNNADVLKLLLEKVSKGETLDKDKNFLTTAFSRYGMNTSVQYLNFQRCDLLLRGLIQPNSSLNSFVSSFKNVLAVSNSTKHKLSSHITFSNSGEKVSSYGLMWKTKLQTAATCTPQIVFNNSTSENEIFVQDTANNIYVLSKSGEILFTKNIQEPVIGRVQQLDYYKNGKQEYIFNSAQHVFIIDRLGNDVASYPLRLSAAASCGLTVAKTGSATRYYIPCGNGSIYGYELNGRPLSGWSPKNGIGVLNESLRCFSNKKNDFALAFNTSGKLMLMDAKGNSKWSVENLSIHPSSVCLIKTTDDFKLLNASTNSFTEISADGNDKLKQLLDTANAFTAFETSDTTYNYYFSNGNQIRAYNNHDEFQTAVSVNTAFISSLELIEVSSRKYLLARDESSKQAFVYDTALKETASFNYGSANGFTIGDLFNRNEFTGVSVDTVGNISCYRLK